METKYYDGNRVYRHLLKWMKSAACNPSGSVRIGLNSHLNWKGDFWLLFNYYYFVNCKSCIIHFKWNNLVTHLMALIILLFYQSAYSHFAFMFVGERRRDSLLCKFLAMYKVSSLKLLFKLTRFHLLWWEAIKGVMRIHRTHRMDSWQP